MYSLRRLDAILFTVVITINTIKAGYYETVLVIFSDHVFYYSGNTTIREYVRVYTDIWRYMGFRSEVKGIKIERFKSPCLGVFVIW